MSGISSGIGLISGIDSASLIDQLMALERIPIDNLQKRVTAIDVQRTAFLELSARLLAVQNAVSGFSKPSFFNRFSANSTNNAVLTATADDGAVPSNIAFRVRSLVSTHALISRGFADGDTTAIGAGTLTIEVGNGKVNKSIELDALNGGQGVRRGTITITDRTGASADIDLTTALTMRDVLDEINSDPNIAIRASVTGIDSNGATGDRIVIEDLSGGAGALSVVDKLGGTLAADLGIAESVLADRIDGSDIVRLSLGTPLIFLNDGNGVGRSRSGTDLSFSTSLGDFDVSLGRSLVGHEDTDLRILNGGNGVRLGVIRITDRSGKSADVDLTGATTARDILNAINAADVAVNATIFGIDDASLFLLTDESGVSAEAAVDLKIEDISGFTAADLGIAGEFDSDSATGKNIYRITTIGDLMNLINFAQGNNALVEASISENGNGLTLTALSPGDSVTVTAGDSGSTTARDLGLLNAAFSDASPFVSANLLAGLDTVLLRSLNGGQGIGAGSVAMTDRAGATTLIDLSGAQTLQDFIDLINADGVTAFVASVNRAGNGITLLDESGGTGALSVADVTGTGAADLGIAVAVNPVDPFVGNVINGGNAQLQYVAEQTLLSEINNGRGTRTGQFQITDSTGAVFSVTISNSSTSIGDVIDAINLATPDTIVARINATGDGILVTDTSGGADDLLIEDIDGSGVAKDLRLVGSAAAGTNFIDGTFEFRIEIDGDDTLRDIAEKINASGGGFSASILNHGSAINPVSLSLSSGVSGRAGELTLDTVGVDLGFSMLSKPTDAVVTIGDDSVGTPLLVSSSSNTLDEVLEGVTLNLLSPSDEAVTVTIAQDVDAIIESIKSFVSSFNDVISRIDTLTSFNPDTFQRGVLLGDNTVSTVRSRLTSVIGRKFTAVPASVSRLFSVGLRLGSRNRLEFDEDKFRDIYDTSPDLVEQLFTTEDSGFGAVIKEVLEEMTRDFDGLIERKNELLSSQQGLLNNRIDGLEILLGAKRARLETQFLGLEISLAALQAQQNSLASLSLLI